MRCAEVTFIRDCAEMAARVLPRPHGVPLGPLPRAHATTRSATTRTGCTTWTCASPRPGRWSSRPGPSRPTWCRSTEFAPVGGAVPPPRRGPRRAGRDGGPARGGTAGRRPASGRAAPRPSRRHDAPRLGTPPRTPRTRSPSPRRSPNSPRCSPTWPTRTPAVRRAAVAVAHRDRPARHRPRPGRGPAPTPDAGGTRRGRGLAARTGRDPARRSPTCATALAAALAVPDPAVRAAALDVLRALRLGDAALFAGARWPTRTSRSASQAVRALVSVDAADDLARAATADPSREVRVAIAKALATASATPARGRPPPSSTALPASPGPGRPGPGRRLAALATAGCPAAARRHGRGRAGRPRLAGPRGRRDGPVRRRPGLAVPALAKALADPNADVRKAAVLALTRPHATAGGGPRGPRHGDEPTRTSDADVRALRGTGPRDRRPSGPEPRDRRPPAPPAPLAGRGEPLDQPAASPAR